MLIKSFLVLLVASAFLGCAPKERVVYKDVYIPVPCDVIVPKRPAFDGNFTSAKKIMIYLESLEKALDECKGDENGE